MGGIGIRLNVIVSLLIDYLNVRATIGNVSKLTLPMLHCIRSSIPADADIINNPSGSAGVLHTYELYK